MKQTSFDSILLHPVIVPTPDVDHGEYQEGDPVEWNGQAWNVLDWNYDRNVFVLLSDDEWDEFISRHDHRNDIRAEILAELWEGR